MDYGYAWMLLVVCAIGLAPVIIRDILLAYRNWKGKR